MPTLSEIRSQYPQYSDMSDADLAGALHKKFYADMPREEFDKKVGLAQEETDPNRIEARKEIDALKAKGAPTSSAFQRRLLQGMTFNAADEILAGLQTPLEMARRGTWSPSEAYKYAKAREDLILEDARKETGALGTAAEIAGGFGSGAGLARGGLSFFSRLPAQAGFGARTAASAGDAALYGAGAGAMEGNTLGERAGNAAQGGVLGALAGAAAPAVTGVLGTVAAPIVSNIRARINPRGLAESQTARAIAESGRTPQQIADELARAAQEGQGMFTAADAMGNAGQRMLSNVTRAPGPGRTQAVEFLEQRQAGQGRRVANALAEGFDAPQTAAQTEARLIAQRRADSDVNYGAARGSAGSVDVTPAIARIDETLQPGITRFANPGSGIADNSIESTLRRARGMLTNDREVLSNFDAALNVKFELDAMIDTAAPTVQRMLIPVRNALDDQLAAASRPYANARDVHRQQSQAIDAVAEGRQAATRGRTENTVPAFRAMRPDQQQGFRAGYVDPLIEQVQGAAAGVNKARPFTSDAFRDEAAAMSPMSTGNQMTRRLGRENTMFETRRQAIGGSQTAENLADMEAMRVDPTIIGNLLSGDISGAARNLLARVGGSLSGYTPAVREELGRILLANGQNPAAIPNLVNMLDQALLRIERTRQAFGHVGRGGMGALAVTPAATSHERR